MARAGYIVKLVRDKIDRYVGGSGTITYEQLNDRELHSKLLRGKLVEEACEYFISPSIQELANVLDVVRCLANVDLGVDITDIESFMVADANDRGSFQDGIVMMAHHPIDDV